MNRPDAIKIFYGVLVVVFTCVGTSVSVSWAGIYQARNIVIQCDKWPSCDSLGQFGKDCIRLSKARSNEEKAIAVWKFIQHMTEVGSPPKEPAYGNYYIVSPIKLLNVYGVHWCDGLSRIMTMTWRALGYRAEKLYKFGHTLADCWWKDSDGIERWHVFDVSQHWFVYDRSGQHVATADELALDYSLIRIPSRTPVPSKPSYMQPCYVHAGHLNIKPHTMGLNLRKGEKVIFLWGNEGRPYYNLYGKKKWKDFEHGPYPITYGNGTLIFSPDLSDSHFLQAIEPESVNLECTEYGVPLPKLHPLRPGVNSQAIIKFAIPYIISDVVVNAHVVKKKGNDRVSIAISTDNGKSWKTVWEPADLLGNINVKNLNICRKFNPGKTKKIGFITPFGRYDFLLKIEMFSTSKPVSCGLDELEVRVTFQHNLFSLPMLWPGKNRINVKGQLDPTTALKVIYYWDDAGRKENQIEKILPGIPAQFFICAKGKRWEDVVCKRLEIAAVKRTESAQLVNQGKIEPEYCRDLRIPHISAEKMIGRYKPKRLRAVDSYIKRLQVLLEKEKRYGNNRRKLRNISRELQRAVTALCIIGKREAKEVLERVIKEDISHPYENKVIACQALYQSIGKEAASMMVDILKRDPGIIWKDVYKKRSTEQMWLFTVNMAAGILADMRDFPGRAKAADLIAGILKGDRMNVPIRKIWRGSEIEWGLIKALGKLGDLRHAPVLYRYLSEGSDATAVAILALMDLKDRSAVSTLVKTLGTFRYSPIGLYSIMAIGQMGNCTDSKSLYRFLYHWDEDFRGETVIALRSLRDVDALPLLREMLGMETHPWVLSEIRKSINILEKIN